MTRLLQRCRAVWGGAQAQDIAEYAVMLAVILLLVIGTLKFLGRKHHGRIGPVPTGSGVAK